MDVFCFLFTDMFLVTKANRRSQDKDKVKVIKPPMRLDKIVVHTLRDGVSFLLVYLNEYHMASAVYTFLGDAKPWVDAIRKAQVRYHLNWRRLCISYPLISPYLLTKYRCDVRLL